MFQLARIRKALLAVLGSCCLLVLSDPRVLSVPVQAARLTGRVIDVNEAAIPNASIYVLGSDGSRVVKSDPSGNYAIELPPGTYTLTTDVPGFHRFRRAAFTLSAQTDSTINLTLWASIGASHSPSLPPQIHYERVALQATSSEMLIQFRNEKKLEDATEYGVVIITCDQLTFKADKGLFYREKNRIELEGNVIIEDGKVTSRVRRVQLDLSRKGLAIQVTKGSISAISGQGSIEGNNIDFNFEIAARGGYFGYRDKKEAIEIVSSTVDSPRTLNDAKNVVTFCGIGRINGIAPTRFTVTIQHDENGREPDMFSIEFGDYARSAALTQGNIIMIRE
jgi:Carboxypeptidase regulatory-like domain